MKTPRAKPSSAVFSQARLIAWETLNQADDQGAWLEECLPRRLAGANLSAADERLCRELVFGAAKARLYLDFALQPLFKHRAPAGWLLNLLRLGAYQLLCLTRIPAHAALHESVELAKAKLPASQDRFVNAVLRELSRRGAPALPDRAARPADYYSLLASLPRYLVERWLARYGEAPAAAMMAAANQAPPLVARVNCRFGTAAETVAWLERQGVKAEILTLPQAVQVVSSSDPGRLPGFAEGRLYYQDQGSQYLGFIVDPHPGETCLDLCSAPGGKTTHLAELMDDRGRVLAYDIHPRKLKRVAENARRLGLASVQVLDGLPDGLTADRVLVDAPCSGLGTLRRHAEIRWRITPDDFKRLAQQQLALLEQGANFTKPGGTLVYSTCSTEPEENESMVESFLARHPECRLAPGPGRDGLPGSEFWGADGFFRTYPGHPEMDGMFAARMIKRS